MKNYLLISLTFVTLQLFGQTKADIERINEAYGDNYAEELAISNPGKFQILAKYSETGFIVLQGDIRTKNVVEINEVPLRKKGETIGIKEFVYILQNETYNPLNFEWIPGIHPMVYKLASTDYFICVPSQEQLERI